MKTESGLLCSRRAFQGFVVAVLVLIAFNREEARGPNTLTFQTGAVYLLSPDLQLDVRAARRLTDRGVDLFVGAGVSWRLGG